MWLCLAIPVVSSHPCWQSSKRAITEIFFCNDFDSGYSTYIFLNNLKFLGSPGCISSDISRISIKVFRKIKVIFLKHFNKIQSWFAGVSIEWCEVREPQMVKFRPTEDLHLLICFHLFGVKIFSDNLYNRQHKINQSLPPSKQDCLFT